MPVRSWHASGNQGPPEPTKGCRMPPILPRTWISGTPRGYGGSRDWRNAVAVALGDWAHDIQPEDHLAVTFSFHINPNSPSYNGQNLPHGTDLDNLVKETLDAMLPHTGRIDDRLIYRIEASKQHVNGDDETGVFVAVAQIEASP